MMLAMKLDAAQRRGRRDGIDLPALLRASQTSTAAEAEAVYEAFYPGDELRERTYAILEDAVLRAHSTSIAIVGIETLANELREAEEFIPTLREHRRRFPELFRADDDVRSTKNPPGFELS